MSQNLGALLWFAAIVALIPLALWLLRRSPMGGRASGGPLRAVGTLPISPQQRLMTVEVGQGDERRWLVLGVTPGSIALLYTLTPGDDALAPPPTPAEGFAQLLNRLKGGRGGPGAD